MTICGSLLIGRGIIKLVFGELWPMESQVVTLLKKAFGI
jgi:hypothetical protein